MQEITLPVGIQNDIDEAFCFREDSSYQERAHEYLERYEVNRGYRDTAVQAVVTDIARRAFDAGAQGCSGGGDLTAIEAELLEVSAKCLRAANQIGGAAMSDHKFVEVEQQLSKSTTAWLVDLGTRVGGIGMRLYVIGPVSGIKQNNRPAFEEAAAALMAEGYGVDIPHNIVPDNVKDWRGAMLHCLHHLTMTRVRCDEGHKGERTGHPYIQGIAMLDGWEESKGAKIEKQVAEALNIPCRPWREYLSPAKGAAALAADGALQPIFASEC